MKRIILILSLLPLLLASCDNNGDIGVFFGVWAVDEATVDGVVDTEYPYGKVFMRFQGNIVHLDLIEEYHVDNRTFVGTWAKTGNILTLNFDHIHHAGQPGGGIPPSLLIPAQAVTQMTMLKESEKQLVLSFVGPAGNTIVLTLRKVI